MSASWDIMLYGNSWASTLIWYLVHVQIFCTGSGARASIFRILLPVSCTFQIFNETAILTSFNPSELLLLAYSVLLLRCVEHFNMLLLAGLAFQVFLALEYGNLVVTQWFLFVMQIQSFEHWLE